MKEKIEISFQDWEKNLPWVKKYISLMEKQDLTLEDCAELPEMRTKAIELHKAREGLQRPSTPVVDNSPKPTFSRAKVVDPVAQKFQNAVDNLIAKFCEPVEAEYALLIKELNEQAPQRDDFLKLTDELQNRYIQAAKLRYLSKTDDKYNDSIVRFRATTQTKPEEVAAKFEGERAKFKKRYVTEVLNKDKLIMQNRISELKDEEARLLETFNKNKAAIADKEKEINELAQPIKLDIASKKATLLPKETATRTLPLPNIIPKAPPQIKKVLGTRNPVKTQTDTPVPKQQSAPSFDPNSILNVTLKKRVVEEKPEQTAVESQDNLGQSTSDMSKAFGSLFQAVQREQAVKTLPVKKEKTLEEVEESIVELAVSTVSNANNIEQMKKCIEQQKTFMRKQDAQLRDLKNKDWKTEIQGEVKKAETSEIPSDAPMTRGAPGKAPPMKFIPKPPPMKKGEPKKVEEKVEEKPVVEEQTQEETPKLTVAQQLQQDLFGKLAQMRKHLEDDDEWEDDEDEKEEKRLRAEAENKRKAEEKLRQQAVVKKYEASVQERNLLPESNTLGGNSQMIANEVLRLETKAAQPSVLTLLEAGVKQLKDLQSQVAVVETKKEETPKAEPKVEEETPKVEKTVETQKEETSGETPKVLTEEITLTEPAVVLEVATLKETQELQPSRYQEELVDKQTPLETLVEATLNDGESESPRVKLKTPVRKSKLEESEESLRLQFEELRKNSTFLQKKVPVEGKQPEIGVIKDIIAINSFVEAKIAEAETKNIDDSDKGHYMKSLNALKINAWNIRLSDEPLAKQKMKLENLGGRIFKARDGGKRHLADWMMFVGCVLIVGIPIVLLVGVGRLLAGHSFFPGNALTQRESDFRKILREDEATNSLIAPVA